MRFRYRVPQLSDSTVQKQLWHIERDMIATLILYKNDVNFFIALKAGFTNVDKKPLSLFFCKAKLRRRKFLHTISSILSLSFHSKRPV